GLSTEGEQLPDHLTATGTCLQHPLEVTLLAAFFGHAVFRQLREPDHGRELVVEVMGDTHCHDSEGLYLLPVAPPSGIAQLLLLQLLLDPEERQLMDKLLHIL